MGICKIQIYQISNIRGDKRYFCSEAIHLPARNEYLTITSAIHLHIEYLFISNLVPTFYYGNMKTRYALIKSKKNAILAVTYFSRPHPPFLSVPAANPNNLV